MNTVHRLGPVAAKSVEAIKAQPDTLRKYIHATIAAEREAQAVLRAYEDGLIQAPDLADRLRDILAICEAASTS